MAEERLETLEVEANNGEEAPTTKADPQEAPATPKRATVASLKKELDEFKQDINNDVLSWIGELDIRLEGLETTTATHNGALLGDVKTRLDIIEKEQLSDRQNVAADIADRLDAVEGATGTIADVIRSHIADTEATPPMAAATAGFAMPPPQTEETIQAGSSMQAIAAKCQTMNDVLMICRAMQGDQTLTDDERKAILKTATTAASVQTTSGLQIRSGVRNIGE